MALHDLPLFIGEVFGLVQDVVANTNLAEVVQRTSKTQLLNLPSAQGECVPELGGEVSDALRVRLGVWITSIERFRSESQCL